MSVTIMLILLLLIIILTLNVETVQRDKADLRYIFCMVCRDAKKSMLLELR